MLENQPFEVISLNDFYPTPEVRIDEPVDTKLLRGDVVKILIGPAIDKIGQVVVERNANYTDYEPYVSPESIGVQVVEKMDIHPELLKALGGITNISSDKISERAVRWFDSVDELEFLLRPE